MTNQEIAEKLDELQNQVHENNPTQGEGDLEEVYRLIDEAKSILEDN